ncbi:YARHG domain-containing protein [Butyricicoccus porcorum]|uniref:YARHG domain-containing protein n=1 Tax=Butyricicoccus porcorum TaxID=1945634 RepID=A0A252F7W8_9FIRM|nr:YARHG domain-containing protein [Butyricicoccus porcorum]MDD6987733.1 YARHG domain-containing protein [Butyricicoccus porcorum]MDY4484281.1 YARHG domain-containing protein [Butyricicoccus porcorum]OUM21867.1 hypothetical protein CBW42_01205 [Butyricicoccus porcorum]
MKQFFQVVRGILLALVVFEALIWLGTKLSILGVLVGSFPVPTAAVVLLLCLYLTFIRKGKKASAAPIDRKEYLVTIAPGAYGRIGGAFDKTKYGKLERLPGGWLEGVRTYRAEDGSLLFTVRQHQKLLLPKRLIAAALVAVILLGPLSALSYVNAANRSIGTLLAGVGLTVHPNGMSYLDVKPVELPQLLSGEANHPSDTNTEPEATNLEDEPATATPADSTQTTEPDTQEETSSGGIGDTISSWAGGVSDWFSGLFGGNYILPSHRRILTDSDVAGMDAAQIQRAINEMYARHGYDLSNSVDAAYFAEQSWYKPDPDKSQDEVRAEFNDTENTNLDFLISCRSRLRS